jgi:DNA-binding CsgD family transcriptional regulator
VVLVHRLTACQAGLMANAPTRTSGSSDANRLGGRALILLQFLARRYTLGQVAAILGVDDAAVWADLERARAVLGAPTFREAAAEAKRRGLIL